MIDRLGGPLFVSWQVTRACDLACLHCCTESAPNRRLADELDGEEAFAFADALIRADVPYVMLCGGEPLVVPHIVAVAERLGAAGVQLKIETNGQALDAATVARLARLPIRSIQVSLDGDSQAVYARQRPGADLARAHAACRMVREAGLPLEITFAPTRLNLAEAEAVIARARALGAFRFNTGSPMRIGTAAKLWGRLSLDADALSAFRAFLDRRAASLGDAMELCYLPFSMEDGLSACRAEPPATLLVLPNGWVKVAAALPYICADVRRQSLAEVWERYRRAWRTEAVSAAIDRAIQDPTCHADANRWVALPDAGISPNGGRQ